MFFGSWKAKSDAEPHRNAAPFAQMLLAQIGNERVSREVRRANLLERLRAAVRKERAWADTVR